MAHNQRKVRTTKATDGEKSKYFEGESSATKELATADASNARPMAEQTPDTNVTIITELRTFRQEVNEALDKLLNLKVTSIDQAVRGLMGRISSELTKIHSCSPFFYIKIDKWRLGAMRWKMHKEENIWDHGIWELEEGDTVKWMEQFLHTILNLPTE